MIVFFSFINAAPTSTKFSMMTEHLTGNNWVVTAKEWWQQWDRDVARIQGKAQNTFCHC
jgi:hypothetical protein